METEPRRPRIVVVIPVGELEGAKSRLGETLDAEERRDLVTTMLRRTVAAAIATPGVAEVLVVTPDDDVRALALEAGARPLRQRSQGLNHGLREARDEALAGGADALIAIPVDLPLVSAEALATLVATLTATDGATPATDGRLVAIVPDRHGRGTNALLLSPPDVIDFRFGGDSRAAHAACAREVGASVRELAGGPLSVDIDTPDDLLLAESLAPEALDVR